MPAFDLPGKGATIEVKKNSATDFQQVINAYGGEREIIVPNGTYPFGNNTLEILIGPNNTVQLTGKGRPTLTYTGTKMLDVLDTSLVALRQLILKNFLFQHTAVTADGSDTTLDLQYSHCDLENITCEEQHSYANNPKYATAYKIGPTGGAGVLVTWRNVRSLNYFNGFELGLDHLIGLGLGSFYSSNYGFWLHGCEWVTLIHVFLGIGGASQGNPQTTVYPMMFDATGKAMQVFAPKIEMGATITLTNPVFNWLNNANSPEIFGFDGFDSEAYITASIDKRIHLFANGQRFGNTMLEYEQTSGAWAAPATGSMVEGRTVLQYNSTQAASRIWMYTNGVWRYVALT